MRRHTTVAIRTRVGFAVAEYSNKFRCNIHVARKFRTWTLGRLSLIGQQDLGTATARAPRTVLNIHSRTIWESFRLQLYYINEH
jgi:hypothetical protein